METPTTEKTRVVWSMGRFRRSAEMIPSGRPATMQKIMLTRVSSKVAGKKSFRSSRTGRWFRMDFPRSPFGQPGDVAEILLGKRAIQAERVAQILDGLPGGLLPGHHPGRIARDGMGDDEDEQRDADQDRDGVEQAGQDVVEQPHGGLTLHTIRILPAGVAGRRRKSQPRVRFRERRRAFARASGRRQSAKPPDASVGGSADAPTCEWEMRTAG